jgi:hypothetical protein
MGRKREAVSTGGPEATGARAPQANGWAGIGSRGDTGLCPTWPISAFRKKASGAAPSLRRLRFVGPRWQVQVIEQPDPASWKRASEPVGMF